MSDASDREPALLHQFRNHLAVVISFADLLLLELPPDDPHRADVLEIYKAARAALALVPSLSKPGA